MRLSHRGGWEAGDDAIAKLPGNTRLLQVTATSKSALGPRRQETQRRTSRESLSLRRKGEDDENEIRQQGNGGRARRARPGRDRDRRSVRSGSSQGAGWVAGAQDVHRAAADPTGDRRSGRRGVRSRRARGHPRVRDADERPAAAGHTELRVLALGLPGPGQRLVPVSRPDHRSPAGEPRLHDRDEQAVPGRGRIRRPRPSVRRSG